MATRPRPSAVEALRRLLHAARQQRDFERGTPLRPAPRRPDPARWPARGLAASWLGHATVLLRLDGRFILTDPALEERIGIGRGRLKVGPRRLTAPALRPRELPPPDLLLLSHAHMDHTDLGTLRFLPRETTVVVQPGNTDLVRRFRRVHELAWGETLDLGGLRVTSLPARHWGARMLRDTHRGYGGYLVEGIERSVLFAGDTADSDVLVPFSAGREIDLAILPIGAYDPWITAHIDPEQAWRLFRALGAAHLLPIHHRTFRLSREPFDEPMERLLAAAGPDAGRVVAREIGAEWIAP